MSASSRIPATDPWPHRLAMLLMCATFPLIWVGGLVTTYDAGMAVPDWPTTYGYNLFLYPWQTWLFGPWDLLIEHGHRLLGALVGVGAIALTMTVWWRDRRRWITWLTLVMLAVVIVQGVLGGQRVLADSRVLAMVHACLGPAFFGLCAVATVVTSRRWHEDSSVSTHPQAARLHGLATVAVAMSFLQLALGAQLRHAPVEASFGFVRTVLMAHLLTAALLAVHVGLLAGCVLRTHRRQRTLAGPVIGLCTLVAIQLMLGAGTWVVKYSWPYWMSGFGWTSSHTIQAKGMFQALTVTAHVATGSLILATSIVLAVRSLRFVRVPLLDFGEKSIVAEGVA